MAFSFPSFRCTAVYADMVVVFAFIIKNASITGKVKKLPSKSSNLLFFTNPAARLFLPPCVFMQF